jgi:hypothetical protein
MKRDIPVLEGWLSLPKAARLLSVTRQRVFQMGAEEDKLTSLRLIPGAGDRPAAYVVGEAEVCKLRREQLEAKIASVKAAGDPDGLAGELETELVEVQLDAVSLLFAQLGAAAEAADVAGDADLARLLRKRRANMRAPVAA